MPIIFLTALSDEEDKLKGYELGADDYVTKPYSLSVLYAKTMALIKRSRGSMSGDVMTIGRVRLDKNTHKVFAGERKVKLTPKEYELLLCLSRNKNIVMSRQQAMFFHSLATGHLIPIPIFI